jgi:hypothetical protein
MKLKFSASAKSSVEKVVAIQSKGESDFLKQFKKLPSASPEKVMPLRRVLPSRILSFPFCSSEIPQIKKLPKKPIRRILSPQTRQSMKGIADQDSHQEHSRTIKGAVFRAGDRSPQKISIYRPANV